LDARFGNAQYDSFVTFYHQVYGDALHEARLPGDVGATMMRLEQDAGDWSDAPTPDLVLNLVERGYPLAHLDLGAGRRQQRVRPGQVAITAPHVATSIFVDGVHALRSLAVPYDRLRALAGDAAGLPTDGDFGALHVGLQDQRDVAALLDGLWAETARGNPYGALWADGALLQLTAVLLRLRDGRTDAPGGLSPFRLRRAIEYMHENLEGDLSLSEIATQVGLSSRHFCTAFRKSTGVPPYRYLVRLRIDRAKEMISGGRSIVEAALACGFASQQHLTTMFRREVGMTPAAWRRVSGPAERTGPAAPSQLSG
jgi:AraC family transcriptional regulator